MQGYFSTSGALTRTVLEQNEEWQLQQHRYMQVEVMAGLVAAPDAADPRQILCAA
jgi:hypothetical protein